MNSLKANPQTKIEKETNLEPESQPKGTKENETMITAAMMDDDHDNSANNEEQNTNETKENIDVPSDEQKMEESNPFAPENLRLSQNFVDNVGVKKHLLSIPVRKPDKQSFIRVHSGEEHSIVTGVLELKEERENYLVIPELCNDLLEEITPKLLCTAITRQGVLFVWPIRMPGSDGRLDDWNKSAHDAAELAKSRWIRVSSNMSLGAYDVFEPEAKFPDPQWPDMPFDKILQLAFKDKLIKSLDHPVVQRLRGAV